MDELNESKDMIVKPTGALRYNRIMSKSGKNRIASILEQEVIDSDGNTSWEDIPFIYTNIDDL